MGAVLTFSDVTLRLHAGAQSGDSRMTHVSTVLSGVDWQVRSGDRWVVLGANGSGKTSLLRMAYGFVFPSSGTVKVLGHTLGRVDVRELRRRVGFASGALTAQLRPQLTADDIVMTAKHTAMEPWWHTYDEADQARARALLEQMGCGHLIGRRISTASDGERQRVQLARTLMVDPDLLLLDEPTAGLDLGGREALVGRLSDLAHDPAAPATVLVTHHVEEIPPGFDQALLLRAGKVLAAGPIEEALTADSLSECFGVPVTLERRDGRYLAMGKPGT